MPSNDLTTEQLIAFAAGELPPPEAAAVEAALQRDPEAAAKVARIRLVQETLRTDESVAPPAASLASAKALFREQQARQPDNENWLAKLQRVVGELVFDSRPQGALAGVRGRQDTYQLAFESELADIDLEVEHAVEATTCSMRGQVSVHADDRAAWIVLARPGTYESLQRIEPDEHGVFHAEVPLGRFDVFVSVRDAVIVLPDVEIE